MNFHCSLPIHLRNKSVNFISILALKNILKFSEEDGYFVFFHSVLCHTSILIINVPGICNRVWRNFDNLAGVHFNSNKIIVLKLDRLQKPTLWLISSFTRGCKILWSPPQKKPASGHVILYPNSMVAAARRALGDDCSDREQKRNVVLSGKSFHFDLVI